MIVGCGCSRTAPFGSNVTGVKGSKGCDLVGRSNRVVAGQGCACVNRFCGKIYPITRNKGAGGKMVLAANKLVNGGTDDGANRG